MRGQQGEGWVEGLLHATEDGVSMANKASREREMRTGDG